MTHISPKHRAKINKENPLGTGNFATVDDLREVVINLKVNNMSLPPDERERMNQLCNNILGT